MEASSNFAQTVIQRLEEMYAERERAHQTQMDRLDAITDALRNLNKAMVGGERNNG